MRIAIDAMGGDLAPRSTVEGALLYDKETGGKHHLVLFGDELLLQSEMERHHFSKPKNISISVNILPALSDKAHKIGKLLLLLFPCVH